MIVLGKDKIDERFNILEDGTIVDLNGKIQKTKIIRDRRWFKGVKVHQIQMWTNYGYRNGKELVIHHLDENKLNNSLSNLVFLTNQEHTSLHHKGKHLSNETKLKMGEASKGRKHSEESKQKIRNGHIGKKRSPFSEETKLKMSIAKRNISNETKLKMGEARKGKHWFNDGIKNYFEYTCPDNCKPGKLNKK